VATGHIPEATVARLPVYLRSLTEIAEAGESTTSSDVLAERAGVNPAKVRKDLSYLGTHGTRGVGYDVRHLTFEVSRALGVANTWPVVVCGLGNLGRALAKHTGFTERGFPVVAAIDINPSLAGSTIDGVPVHTPDQLGELVETHHISIGVIATPAAAAQETADLLVAAGVRSILDFSPTVVNVPDHVEVRAVDLSTELQILGFHLQSDVPPGGPAPAGLL
jgi:redox-sensing transcriptional repressor